MTKKDYVLLAKAIGSLSGPSYLQILSIAEQLGKALKKENKLFDQSKFTLAVEKAWGETPI